MSRHLMSVALAVVLAVGATTATTAYAELSTLRDLHVSRPVRRQPRTSSPRARTTRTRSPRSSGDAQGARRASRPATSPRGTSTTPRSSRRPARRTLKMEFIRRRQAQPRRRQAARRRRSQEQRAHRRHHDRRGRGPREGQDATSVELVAGGNTRRVAKHDRVAVSNKLGRTAVDHRVDGDAELLERDLAGRRSRRSDRCRSRCRGRRSCSRQPNVTPASTDTRCQRAARQHALAIRRVLLGEQLPARHRHDARRRCRASRARRAPRARRETSEPVAMMIASPPSASTYAPRSAPGAPGCRDDRQILARQHERRSARAARASRPSSRRRSRSRRPGGTRARCGIARSAIRCSTGWCVGPSSPRPTESCVHTKIAGMLVERREPHASAACSR